MIMNTAKILVVAMAIMASFHLRGQIGTQIWMAENLKVSHYPNGDTIPYVINNSVWSNLEDNDTDGAYCFYNNDNTTDYGVLYTYAAAIGNNWTRDNSNTNEAGGQGGMSIFVVTDNINWKNLADNDIDAYTYPP
jgi:hypothetical protein